MLAINPHTFHMLNNNVPSHALNSPQKLVTNLRTIWFSRLNGSVQLILVLYDLKNDIITYDETSGSFEIFLFSN